jgi:hypothetical protein
MCQSLVALVEVHGPIRKSDLQIFVDEGKVMTHLHLVSYFSYFVICEQSMKEKRLRKGKRVSEHKGRRGQVFVVGEKGGKGRKPFL